MPVTTTQRAARRPMAAHAPEASLRTRPTMTKQRRPTPRRLQKTGSRLAHRDRSGEPPPTIAARQRYADEIGAIQRRRHMRHSLVRPFLLTRKLEAHDPDTTKARRHTKILSDASNRLEAATEALETSRVLGGLG